MGGSSIVSYNLYWDQGNGNWITLVGQYSNYLGTSFTMAIGIVQGNTYNFKVRAKNKWGFGAFSTPFPIFAAGPPAIVPSAVTSYDPTTQGLAISWGLPVSNGAAISGYIINIKDSASAWQVDSSCNGNNFSIMSSRSCVIPMQSIYTTLGLTINSPIYIQVSAINSQGTGLPSTNNALNAIVKTIPVALSAILRGSDTTEY